MLPFISASAVLIAQVKGSFTSTPLVNGAEFHANLQHGEIVCRSVAVPSSASRVVVKASAVGLAGNPNLFGGWDEKVIMDKVQQDLAPVNSGGYHIFSDYYDVPGDRNSFYLCMTSFSTQGSDVLLTATVQDAASWYAPQVAALENYPVVWRLDGKGPNYVDFGLPLSAHTGNVTVSLTPLSGEVDLVVSDCASWDEALGVSASVGPDIVSVAIQKEAEKLCIRVNTRDDSSEAEFALVAWSDPSGPFVAQSVPLALTLRTPNLRSYFKPDIDLSITARGFEPETNFVLTVDTEKDGTAWRSLPDGRVEVDKSALKGRTGNVLYIRGKGEDADAKYIVTVTSHGSVETLEDGIPVPVTVDGDNRFNDYRVWVPLGTEMISLQGDSSGDGSGLGIFASTIRTSHDPRGYLWNTMTGTNDLFFTTNLTRTDERIRYLGCSDCYLYLSVKSCLVKQGQCSDSGSSKYVLTVATDKSVSKLVEGILVTNTFVSSKRFLFDHAKKGEEKLYFFVSPNSDISIVVRDAHSKDDTGALTSQCPANSRCVIVVEPDTALGKADLELRLEGSSGDLVFADVVARNELGHQQLKNHHPVIGSVDKTRVDRYSFYIPEGGEDVNALVDFVSKSASLRVCDSGDISCQSITGSGVIHVSRFGSVSLQVTSDSEDSTNYELTPSFFSSISNSLRVGYKPVTVAVEPNSKLTFQIGYYDPDEWLLTVTGQQGDTSALTLCFDDKVGSSARCSGIGNPAQGFGRQVVWLENKGDPKKLVSLSTESLSTLVEGKSIDISNRKSEIFKISSYPAKIDTDGSISWIIGRPDGDLLASPPLEADVNGQTVYAQIHKGTTAKLVELQTLFLNEWKENSQWNKYKVNPSGDHKPVIRVERCDLGTEDSLVMNGKTVAGNHVDVPASESGDISVESAGQFRTGLFSSKPVSFDIKTSALIGSLVDDSGYVFFNSPVNADGSLYRTLCLAETTGITPSQCVVEHSSNAVHGPPTSCAPKGLCQVPIPSSCTGFVTVVADKGPEYGIFEPIRLGSVYSGEPVEDEIALPRSSGWISFFFKGVIVYVLYQFIIANRVWLKIQVMRLINLVRRGRLRSKGLLEDTHSLESGYRAMKELGPMSYGRSNLVNRNFSAEMQKIGGGYSPIYHGA